jgi:hypothetical protein
VSEDVPDYAVVLGNPAIVRRWRFDEPTIARLLQSRWWQLAAADVAALPMADPMAMLAMIESR